MISAAALRKLAALSLSPEQMAGVLDILADGAEAEEARKAAQRDRTRRHRSRDGNVTDTLQARDPSLEKETSPKPPKENSTLPTPASGDKSPSAGSAKSAMQEFQDRFWSIYPKREGSNPRKPASDKFAALVRSGVDAEAIIAAAARYAAELKAQGKAGTVFVAQAQTWLNQQRFSDYSPSSTASTPAMASVEQWEARLGYARKTAAWDRPKWGPPPTEPGCVVPPELLKPGDGNGWKPPNEASAA